MSDFAKRFTGLSGIASLMEDLGDALNQYPDLIFMGGGNPAQIYVVEECVAKHINNIVNDGTDNGASLHKLIGEYQPPQGDPECRAVLAKYLSEFYFSGNNTCQQNTLTSQSGSDSSNQQSAWPMTADNVAISNGGQSAFFSLFNMFAGHSTSELSPDETGPDKTPEKTSSKLDSQSDHKRILLPMVPDYLGYADAGLDGDMFQTIRPLIENQAPPFFKYKIDFDNLHIDQNIAAVCLSRPANPSGNIVTDDEIVELKKRCAEYNIPLIIDLAYGSPFPNITFVDHHLEWDENTILVLSLSKLGLPGVRTGIVIAAPDIIKRFSRATASLSLAPSNLGPALCKSLIRSSDLSSLVDNEIRPYYHDKMQKTTRYLVSLIQNLPVNIHQPEGAFFLWLWLKDLPINSQTLYQNLKDKGLLVLSGHHFFEPLGQEEWPHRDQCIRLSYCQPWEKVKAGIDILIDELNQLYEG
ncbi:MAG: aminotransferase class I/II-fold pyridoxal phosphate-dependent enzyme [Cellvibrionaceae bacterium]